MTRLPTGASRWQQLKRLLQSAIELPPAEQQSYLDDACAGDPSLRREVESLMVHADAEDFLEYGVARAAAEALDLIETVDLEGQHLGPWKIGKRIGEGGMGAVYLAERADGEFTKQVAIKVVRQRVASDGVLRRFRAERQILANIDHPNIARLIDAGSTDDGLPYLVMEYVEGEPIDEYCDNERLTIEKRLELFRQVCAAVQRAHDRHVVHRDLKPSNVLITKDGTPKLLDFGIAKVLAPELLDRSVEVTAEFQRLMTPAFASPEQIRGEPVTTASDVYSLGVILYGLVCGHSPYDEGTETSASIEEIVCDLEPPAPSSALRQFTHTVGPDGESIALTPEAVSAARGTDPGALVALLEAGLDATVLKALAKEPSARYASAAELGDAIEGYVRGGVSPEQATPASWDTVPAPESPGSGTIGAGAATQPPAPLFEWGHLQVVRKVGEGNFGEVFEARDPSLKQTVALKLFRSGGEGDTGVTSEIASRVLREGRMLARVDHPNVMVVHGVAIHDDTVGIWMKFIHGSHLEQLMELQGRFGEREACGVGLDLCSALAAVHREGIVHRDIKAQNVIREEGGKMVLADFGSGHDLVGDARLGQGQAAGTPLYMAPEVLRGEVATVQADIYSLGVLLFRLVTGAFPFEADSWSELIDKHDSGAVRLVRDLRPELRPRVAHVIDKALAVDPQQRFSSAAEMQQALEIASGMSTDLPLPIPDPSTSADAEARQTIKRMSRSIAALGYGAGSIAFLTLLGLLTFLVERQAMRVPQGFASPAVFDFLTLGIRASVAAVVSIVISFLVVWSVLTGASRADRVRSVLESTSIAVLAKMLIGFGVVGIGLNVYVHFDLWWAIIALSDERALLTADLTLLSNVSRQVLNEWSFAAVAASLLVGVVAVFRRPKNNEGEGAELAWLVGGLVLTAAAAVLLLAMPWRLLAAEHTSFTYDVAETDPRRWVEPAAQTGDLNGRRAFIIERSEGDLWIYFPDFLHGMRVDDSLEIGPTSESSIFSFGAGTALDR